MRQQTPLGMPIYRHEAMHTGPPPGVVRDRILVALTTYGELPLGELSLRLSQQVPQRRLHSVLAGMRDAGLVEIRHERRHPRGRARVVVSPTHGGCESLP